jgi:iron(III)-salmochelin esterase
VLICIVTLLISGCLSESQDASGSGAASAKQDAQGTGAGKAVKSSDSSPGPAPAPVGVAPEKGPSQSTVDELSGYKAPAEYLTISSKHYPGAVVAVTLPLDYKQKSKKRYPLVIAFGGMGECVRPPRQGALAWLHYYKSDEAILALQNNRLESQDFRGLVTPEQLATFNSRLKNHPYRGIILACPSSPPLTLHNRLEIHDYETFIIEDLLPALKKSYRVRTDRIGIDGVSMGGARSMYYGFKYPDVFVSIGSVQGAFGPYMPLYRELLAKNKDLIGQRSIQLVTSDKDTMGPSVEKLHRLLVEEGVKHTYLKLTGPHDYVFNQGPGALALLLFHNQALPSTSSGPVR